MDDLTLFLTSLNHLRKLVLKATPLLCLLFAELSHPINPYLQHLHLEVTYNRAARTPFLSNSLLDRLTAYPNLTHLGLIQLAPHHGTPSVDSSESLRFSALTSLEIGGSLTNPAAYQELLKRCSPTELTIVENADSDDSHPVAVPMLLSMIVEPHLVKKLVLDSGHRYYSMSNVDSDITKLVNLDELSLYRQASFGGWGFYENLGKLPLRKLMFGPGTSVSWRFLRKELFSVEPRSLQYLELHHVSAVRGDESDPTLDEFGDSWALADWDDFFSLEDCRELIKLGQELGIEVRGSTIEAVAIEEEHRELLKRWKEENPDEELGTSEAAEDEEVEGDGEEGESEAEEEGTLEREDSDGHSEGYYYRTP